MKKPSKKQIDAEIKKLKNVKPRVPHANYFGDDNYEKIDAQITVLQEGLTENDVYDRFDDPEEPDKTCDLVSNARDAAMWLIGEAEDGAPSKGWEEIAK